MVVKHNYFYYFVKMIWYNFSSNKTKKPKGRKEFNIKNNAKVFGYTAFGAGVAIAVSTAVPFAILYQKDNKDGNVANKNNSSKGISDLENKLDTNKQELNKLKQERDLKDKELKKAIEELKKRDADKAISDSEIQRLKQEIEGLKQEKEELNKKIIAKDKEIADLKKEVKRLNGMLTSKYGIKNIAKTSLNTGFIKRINGVTYVGTETNGLMKLENNKLISVDKTDVSTGFMEEINGTIYVGTKTGLMKLENNKLVSAIFEADGKTPDTQSFEGGFIKEIHGTIWAGNDAGLFKLENNKLSDEISGVSSYKNGFIKEIDGKIYVGDGALGSGLQIIIDDKDITKIVFKDAADPMDINGMPMTTYNGFIEKINGKIYVGGSDELDQFIYELVGNKFVPLEAIHLDGTKRQIKANFGRMMKVNGEIIITNVMEPSPGAPNSAMILKDGKLFEISHGLNFTDGDVISMVDDVLYYGDGSGLYIMEKEQPTSTKPAPSIY